MTSVDPYASAEFYHSSHGLTLRESGFFSSLSARHGRILELGCGTGRLYPCLTSLRSQYVGVDKNPEMLKLFQRHHPKANLVQADWDCLPLNLSWFDCMVLARNTWFHVPKDRRLNLLQSWQDLLCRNGVLVLEFDDSRSSTQFNRLNLKEFYPQTNAEVLHVFRSTSMAHIGTVRLSRFQIALIFQNIGR